MKKSLKVLALFIAFAICLGLFFKIFSFKFIEMVQHRDYYNQPKDSIDVLFLGSSHCFTAVNPAQLYNEHGIASYVIGGSVMTLWNAYYSLEEALSYQTPKLVMVEAFGLNFEAEIMDPQYIIRNTYPMKDMKAFVQSIQATAPTDESMDYLLKFRRYHSRYNDLNVGDFHNRYIFDDSRKSFLDLKGYILQIGTKPIKNNFSESMHELDGNITAKNEKYLRKIIELCIQKGIPVEIFISPMEYYDYLAGRSNTAKKICEEYGAAFTDFNFLTNEFGLNYETDFEDEGHMNYKGGLKFNAYLGNQISSNMVLPDRRGDEKWNSWAVGWLFTLQCLLIEEAKESNDMDTMLTKAVENAYYTVVYKPADEAGIKEAVNPAVEYVKKYFPEAVLVGDCYLYDKNNNIDMMNKDFFKMKSVESKVIDVSGDNFNMNGVNAKKVSQGVNIAIYDGLTNSFVCSFGVNQDMEMVR